VHRGFLPFNVSHSVVVDETWCINSLDGQEFTTLLYNNSRKKANWLQHENRATVTVSLLARLDLHEMPRRVVVSCPRVATLPGCPEEYKTVSRLGKSLVYPPSDKIALTSRRIQSQSLKPPVLSAQSTTGQRNRCSVSTAVPSCMSLETG